MATLVILFLTAALLLLAVLKVRAARPLASTVPASEGLAFAGPTPERGTTPSVHASGGRTEAPRNRTVRPLLRVVPPARSSSSPFDFTGGRDPSSYTDPNDPEPLSTVPEVALLLLAFDCGDRDAVDAMLSAAADDASVLASALKDDDTPAPRRGQSSGRRCAWRDGSPSPRELHRRMVSTLRASGKVAA